MNAGPVNGRSATPAVRSSPLDQQYSLSDRLRYYWPVPAVEQAWRACQLEENLLPLAP
jgi:tagatose-1,6-bisphosphate aldolase non-catalytic subunit AgaZ/GatZ